MDEMPYVRSGDASPPRFPRRAGCGVVRVRPVRHNRLVSRRGILTGVNVERVHRRIGLAYDGHQVVVFVTLDPSSRCGPVTP